MQNGAPCCVQSRASTSLVQRTAIYQGSRPPSLAGRRRIQQSPGGDAAASPARAAPDAPACAALNGLGLSLPWRFILLRNNPCPWTPKFCARDIAAEQAEASIQAHLKRAARIASELRRRPARPRWRRSPSAGGESIDIPRDWREGA